MFFTSRIQLRRFDSVLRQLRAVRLHPSAQTETDHCDMTTLPPMPLIKPIRKNAKRLAVVALVGLIVYLLSSGPALYLVRREMLSERVFRFVYKPLANLEDWRPYVLYSRWWYNTKAERDLIWTEEHWTTAQWLQHAMEETQKQGAPASGLFRSFQPKQWAGHGYLLFSNGWAVFISHSSHDSEMCGGRIGNIALLRTSDGDFYVSDFHFCMGDAEFHGSDKIQPRDFSQFLELYGGEQKWRKKQ